jgi:hypothetical protein
MIKMKSILLSAALSFAVVVSAIGQVETSHSPQNAHPAVIKCTGPGGGACTQQQVLRLATAVHQVKTGPMTSLISVKTLTLASSDGTLSCIHTSGQTCTAQQGQQLYEIGRAFNLMISFPGRVTK